jgi:hypothetical protein
MKATAVCSIKTHSERYLVLDKRKRESRDLTQVKLNLLALQLLGGL